MSFEKINKGDIIRASWLNGIGQMAADALQPQRQFTPDGRGPVVLFKSLESFSTYEDIYRGKCHEYWRKPADEEYDFRRPDEATTDGEWEYVYSQTAVSNSSVITAFFNHQSGRWEVMQGGVADGGQNNTNSTPCCNTVIKRGSVDLYGVEWTTDYVLSMGNLGTVLLTNQGSYWESDEIEVLCNDGADTDTYRVTMTPGGYSAGDIILTVEMVTGGGYGGASACCYDSSGFAWRYVNPHIVDPLATIPFVRDPSGFTGRTCDPGPCITCASPQVGTIECGDLEFAEQYRLTFSDDGTSGSPFDGSALNNESRTVEYTCAVDQPDDTDCYWVSLDDDGEPEVFVTCIAGASGNYADGAAFAANLWLNAVELAPNSWEIRVSSSIYDVINTENLGAMYQLAQPNRPTGTTEQDAWSNLEFPLTLDRNTSASNYLVYPTELVVEAVQ